QLVYETFPALEGALRLVPGLYSLWLRAWGSRIGRGVYWTPGARIRDRSLLIVGDRVIFGEGVECFSHLVSIQGSRLMLFVAPITIGDGAFLGGFSKLAPGVVLEAGAVLGAFSRVGPVARITAGANVPAGTDVPGRARVG